MLSLLFFASAVAYLALGTNTHPIAHYARDAQIIPSIISHTFGITLFWLVVTFFFGRIYCSSVCPIGILQDIFISLHRRIPLFGKRLFRWHMPFRFRTEIVVLYIACLIAGIVVVPLLIEPWYIMTHIISVIIPSAEQTNFPYLALGSISGFVTGIVSFVVLAIWSMLRGREFCNTVCPIGISMGSIHSRTFMHIEINPDKCSSCMKCEEVCKASCIKVVGRYVDNSRCIRCFNCIDICRDHAIKYQINNNRAATPMLKRTRGQET